MESTSDLGVVRRVDVTHNGSRGWLLAWVKITNESTGYSITLPCNRCVPCPLPALCVPRRSRCQRARVQFRRRPFVLCPRRWVEKQVGLVECAAELHAAALSSGAKQGTDSTQTDATAGPPDPGAAENRPGYQVTFVTSRACLSGTRAKVSSGARRADTSCRHLPASLRCRGHLPPPPAYPIMVPSPCTAALCALFPSQVFFEVVGEAGRSGIVAPSGTASSFQSGRVDVFTFPHMPSLGQLTSARVGTDGSGLLPAWHLRRLEVLHIPTRTRWTFEVDAWVDRKCGFARWLRPRERGARSGGGKGATSAGDWAPRRKGKGWWEATPRLGSGGGGGNAAGPRGWAGDDQPGSPAIRANWPTEA